MITGREALERLREGNRRFVSGMGRRDALTDERRRREVANGQEPFAIVLGCSDSRVPAESSERIQIPDSLCVTFIVPLLCRRKRSNGGAYPADSGTCS